MLAKKVAEAYIAQLSDAKVYNKPIVTKVGPLEGFFAAEASHQDYLTLHPNQRYIAYNDIPKVENLKKIFAQIHREAYFGERYQSHQLVWRIRSPHHCCRGDIRGLLNQSHTRWINWLVSFRFRSSKRGSAKCDELKMDR